MKREEEGDKRRREVRRGTIKRKIKKKRIR